MGENNEVGSCNRDNYSRRKIMRKSIFATDALRISITNTCNFDCIYCSNEGQQHNEGQYLNIEFIKAFCRKIKNENIYLRRVNITGGEPLLHPELFYIIHEFAQVTDNVALNTNGSLINKNKLKNLVKYGVNTIKIGIDNIVGVEAKPCLSIQNINNPEHLKRNILLCKQYIQDTSLDVVLSSANAMTIDSVVKFVINNKLNNTLFIELIQSDFWNNGIIPDKGLSFQELLQILIKNSNKLNYSFNSERGIYNVIINDKLHVFYTLDYCKYNLCNNLSMRVNSNGEFVSCVKENIQTPIDLCGSLINQVNNIKRDYSCRQN